ncbi:hypothetical protein HK097_002379 [Rhizophlyctis rosea]|uniref:Uncharacterized protein n=1 Tax=Rhizophlyctis rosea TaxID=64517 RepID=A0AAD5SB22_9FUNG|nr:hypothetical protein HK097_002379 [Rhizophlyctis rosea]
MPEVSEVQAAPSTSSPFRFVHERLQKGAVFKFRAVTEAGTPVTHLDAMKSMQATDPQFMPGFLDTLATCPFRGYFFETPAMTGKLAGSRDFEYVLVDSPSLAAKDFQPDKKAFEDHLAEPEKNGEPLASFLSLSGDAMLIAPTQHPETATSAYSNIATFSRSAPMQQQKALWKEAATAVLESYESDEHKPFWLSTSGMGVFWLHLRVDTRPKYYAWGPYRKLAAL